MRSVQHAWSRQRSRGTNETAEGGPADRRLSEVSGRGDDDRTADSVTAHLGPLLARQPGAGAIGPPHRVARRRAAESQRHDGLSGRTVTRA
jgi:hypothetical protein